MNKIFELLMGLILIVVPVWVALDQNFLPTWGPAALTVIKGSIVIGLVCIGLLFLILGISDLKE